LDGNLDGADKVGAPEKVGIIFKAVKGPRTQDEVYFTEGIKKTQKQGVEEYTDVYEERRQQKQNAGDTVFLLDLHTGLPRF
jgi:hypothetical protein